MPRKAFVADIAAAAEKSIDGVSSVVKGDDDGDVNFCFMPSSGVPIEIGLLAMDVAGYPAENSFMIFTRSSEIPNGVNEVLEQLAEFSAGMRVPELLATISQKLQNVLATGSQDAPFGIDSSDVEMIDGDGEQSEDEDDDDDEDNDLFSDYGYEDNFGPVGRNSNNATYQLSPESAAKLNRRIKEDLRAVKFTGFKLGILSGMKADSQTCLLCISIQVAKLGLSDEAIQAWDLEPQQYIILLIRYSSGYKDFEAIISEPAKSLDIAFRIGVGNRYKPTINEALAAFSDSNKGGSKPSENNSFEAAGADNPTSGFSSLFISSSLNEFINGQFISLLKIRNSMGLGWDGAKHFFNDKQGRMHDQKAELPSLYYEESVSNQTSLSDIMTADHLVDNRSKEISFPLIAAQFSMRYLLRCTEFCLVCHDKIQEGFEALKPYVCNKPLCLYQYMSLGFGPSVEHEILTQPYVVDLLVSFCYVSAMGRRLREYPTGMALMVPPVATSVTQPMLTRAMNPYNRAAPSPPTSSTTETGSNSLDVKFDAGSQELVFGDAQSSPVNHGDWVVITTAAGHSPLHYRIEDVSLYPTAKLSEVPVIQSKSTNIPAPEPSTSVAAVPVTPATTPPPPALAPAKMTIYDQNFDDMNDQDKAETIVMLLETLPSVKEMRAYLIKQGRSSEPSLRTWKRRVSPAALGILRWIIASNRSCLIQVDKCPGQEESESFVGKIRLDQKVMNVADTWVQFRFAQGAPDKEQRFLNALKQQQGKLNPKYPTIFAFHGSPLANWHSIIRSGLDFKETLHGRAYGHGVYHAQDQNTSVGYAMPGVSCCWPGSELRIATAMSLNEIVNCPGEFASATPFLVVQHIDWIQCRYLFVQSGGVDPYATQSTDKTASSASDSPRISDDVEQDPTRVAKSTLNKAIGVPECALLISRAFRLGNKGDTPFGKRRKHGSSSGQISLLNTTAASDDEEPEDLTFLFSDEEAPIAKGKGKEKSTSSKSTTQTPQTDFVPGSLDQSKLPMLNAPEYATSSATMRLNKELKAILEVQKKTPLHELGWYIDADLVSNVYQWIVELHSFEPTLPLAQDMKKAGITSIVCEIRFGKDYPHSPPFVRVIRPRFLPFTQGGGGHVTAGGAMCMELLTNSGWSAASSIESVLLQVRMAIMNLEPKPARMASTSKHQQDYGTGEAMEAYIRACRTHGWTVPKDFQDFAGEAALGAGC